MTAVWRCEPRSLGRNKAATPLPGRTPSVAVPHRSASPPVLFPCGNSVYFRRRASSFVRGVWSRRRCYGRRRWAGRRGACGSQCGTCARAAVLWLRLLQRRRLRCDCRGARRRACGAQCERGGCVHLRAGCSEGGRSVRLSCKHGACRGASGVRAPPLFLCARCY